MSETVRSATTNDLESITLLVNSAYRGDSSKQGWTTEADFLDGQRTDPDSLRETIAKDGNVILLLEAEHQLMACVHLQHRGQMAYLGMLTVKPDRQSGGFGRHLLEHAENFAKTQWQVPTIEMRVIQRRPELIAWYQRRGYTITDRTEPFPYGDSRFGLPKVDDLQFIILEKSLV